MLYSSACLSDSVQGRTDHSGDKVKGKPDEGYARAAVVVGVLRYTDWPDTLSARSPRGDLFVCWYGNALSIPQLKRLSEQAYKVNNQEFRVLEYSTALSPRCQVVIVGAALESSDELFADLASLSSVLIICDECQREREFSAVHIKKVGGDIHFDVDLGVAEQHNITFGSPMLELASRVEGIRE